MRSRTALPLVAALALVTLELVRSSGPLLDMAFTVGVTAAAGAAVLTYALPGLLAIGVVTIARRRATGPVRVLTTAAVAAAIGVAAVRLVLPLLTAGVRFGVGLAAVALAVAALTLAVAASTARHGGAATARALVLGLVTNVGVQLALGTWDAVWRTDLAGWAVTAGTVAALVATARVAAPAADGDPGGPGAPGRPRLWALGPFLALAAMMLANPAFAASQPGLPLAIGGAVLAAALLLGAGLAALDHPGSRSTLQGPVLVLLLGAAATGALLGEGPPALVSLVLLAITAPRALALALSGRPRPVTTRTDDATGEPAPAQAQPWRAAGAVTAVGLSTILPLLVYQLDYDVPLGFPSALVLTVTGALLGAAGVGARAPARPGPAQPVPAPLGPSQPGPVRPSPAATRPVAVTAVAAVVVGTVLVALPAVSAHRGTTAGADPRGTGDTATAVVWNLHYGVTPAGHVALEEVARSIERTDACVVLLQEVSRGWVMGGGADMATWLAHRLGMRMSFAPAADGQFGNAVLTCAPHDDVVVHALPYGAGPQQRSAISATVELAEPQRYTSVHLQHRADNTPTRLAQLDALLGDGDLGVLAGDFNAEPGSPEIETVLAAGFTSAQDAVGDPDRLTSPTVAPRHRIDWAFVPDGVEPVALTHLTEDLWSDHVALVLTHRVGG